MPAASTTQRGLIQALGLMEQDLSLPRSKSHRLLLYGAAAAILIGSFLIFRFYFLLYVVLVIIVFLGAGLPVYVRYWKRGLGLEVTLLVGALLVGGLAGVAWEQLS